MSLSARVRFEILKRDRFTCAYCGRTPPTVLLEVDHIVPRAAGGSDDDANLVTACQDCNRGKSDKFLNESVVRTPTAVDIEEAEERHRQAVAYAELVASDRALLSRMRDQVMDAWCVAFGGERTDTGWRLATYGQFPDDNSLRVILRRLSLAEVLEAVDITASRWSNPQAGACRYFYKVCWNKIRRYDA